MLIKNFKKYIHTYYKEKHRGLVVASKEIGLEENATKTKYIVMINIFIYSICIHY